MDMLTIVALDVLILVFLLMMSVPLPWCFAGALGFMALVGGASMKSMMLWGFNQTIGLVLLGSPLFILAGMLIGASGIARYLLDFVDIFVGRIRGGLGAVAVFTCGVIGAISGSGFTGVAATGPILIPRMVAMGYPLGYATALVTVSSILGLLIPPSIVMIFYGWVTETSILAGFLSTVGPGLMVIVTFCTINFIWARKFDLKLAEKLPRAEQRAKNAKATLWVIPALSLPFIILGGIYGGVFTPTEAAAVGAVVALPIGFFVYKELSGKKLVPLGIETGQAIGSILTMIFFTLMLSQTYVLLKVPEALISIVMGITTDPFYILIMVNLLLFIVGMIVNDITGMILVAPLLLPLMKTIGVDPIHFAAIMGVNLAMGGVTPPYASILYLGMRVGKCEFKDILGPTMIFLIFGYVPVVFVTTYWPDLSLWLPRMAGLVQ